MRLHKYLPKHIHMKVYRDNLKEFISKSDTIAIAAGFEEMYIESCDYNKNVDTIARNAFNWASDKKQEHGIIITDGIDWHIDDLDQLGTVLLYVMDCGAGYYLECRGYEPLKIKKHQWISFNQKHEHRLYKSNLNVYKSCNFLVIGYKDRNS